MKIKHHPHPSTLLSYSAGSLAESASGIVATHIELCKACRQELDFLDVMGGAMLASLPPARITKSVPAFAVRRVEAQVVETRVELQEAEYGTIPSTLAQFVGTSFKDITWQRLGRGIWIHELTKAQAPKSSLRLIKLSKACVMPAAKYGGVALSIVLSGFLRDPQLAYGPGDVIDCNECAESPMIADEFEGCIALNASEKPHIRPGLLSRLMYSSG